MSRALPFEEGLNFKWISRGHTSLPILVSIIVLLELEDLHILLALVCHYLNTRLPRFLSSQRLIKVILKTHIPFLEDNHLRLQHGFCHLSMLAHLR